MACKSTSLNVFCCADVKWNGGVLNLLLQWLFALSAECCVLPWLVVLLDCTVGPLCPFDNKKGGGRANWRGLVGTEL